MPKAELISKIKEVEKIAAASKVKRMFANPFKYVNAILFRKLIYKRTKREKEVMCSTFFDVNMHLLLPSSTDIYLTGGKSHDSEIRLAKFLINSLNNNDTFVDVGAHYGYFSLLASKLVGDLGQVFSFEASPTTYSILKKNKTNLDNIAIYNVAVSDSNSHLVFYEFPNLYSEYNSLDIEQFKNEKWFSEYQPKEVKIKSVVLDDFFNEKKIHPKIVKIDVEGAEFKVINGLKEFLQINNPFIIIEYLSDERGNKEHIRAEQLLKSFGFQAYVIDGLGELQTVNSISDYIQNKKIDSDNIVFKK